MLCLRVRNYLFQWRIIVVIFNTNTFRFPQCEPWPVVLALSEKIWQCFESLTEIRKICREWESFGELASLGKELLAKNTKFFSVFESFLVRIIACCDKQVVNLVLAVAEAVLGHVVHCVHHLCYQGQNSRSNTNEIQLIMSQSQAEVTFEKILVQKRTLSRHWETHQSKSP